MRPPGVSERIAAPDPRRAAREAAGRPYIGKVFLGKYRLAQYLGEGSNAHVFLAQRVDRPGQSVVVKRIKDAVAASPRFRQFFDNEVRSMRRFNHPYSVRLLDAALDDPMGVGLVLEYIPGKTLDGLMQQQRRLGFERACRLIAPLCHALDAAHEAGIVHRDVKPANVMVTGPGLPDETVRVMDFGFAGFTAKPHIQLAELTGTGPMFACGTPAYVSPEMVRGDAVDGRGDLYSVGVILYEMLTGRLPFDMPTQEEMLAAHIQSAAPKFHRVGAGDVPPVVEAVVHMLLAKYPNERPQTGKAILDLLSRATGTDLWATHLPPPHTPEPPSVDEDGCEVVELVAMEPAPAVVEKRPEDQFLLSDRFKALLPERLAAAKIRGFIEDNNGVAVSSEPGLIRVRLDVPAGAQAVSAKASGSGLFAWISSRVIAIPSGKEPIELDLEMLKVGPDTVEVTVAFRPMPRHLPTDAAVWNARCEGYYSILRKYLMAADSYV